MSQHVEREYQNKFDTFIKYRDFAVDYKTERVSKCCVVMECDA